MQRRWMHCEIIIASYLHRCKSHCILPVSAVSTSSRYSNTLEASLAALNQEHVDILVRDVPH